MAKDSDDFIKAGSEPFRAFFDMQGEAMREMMGKFGMPGFGEVPALAADAGEYASVAREIQSMWFEFMAERSQSHDTGANPFDPARFEFDPTGDDDCFLLRKPRLPRPCCTRST